MARCSCIYDGEQTSYRKRRANLSLSHFVRNFGGLPVHRGEFSVYLHQNWAKKSITSSKSGIFINQGARIIDGQWPTKHGLNFAGF